MKKRFMKGVFAVFVGLPMFLSAGLGEEQAANELMDTIRLEKTMKDAVHSSVEMLVQMQPNLANQEALLEEFFGKYMNVEAYRQKAIAMYANAFSIEELQAIAAFYKTEAGQKLLEKQPEIMKETVLFTNEQIFSHIGELEEVLMQGLSEEKTQ